MRTNRLALLVAAAIAAGCSQHTEPPKEEVRPVRSVAVSDTLGSVGASYAGEVRARYESKLGFRIPGKVAQRLVEVGQHVERGQLLMRLDPEQEVLRSASAAATVDAAKSRLDQAKTDLARTEQLFARKFASQSELDQARVNLSDAEANLLTSRSQKDLAANQRAYTELRSDRTGVVTAITAEAGQVVSAGQPTVTVAADGEREVAVSIPEARVAELRNAKRMTVSLWANPGKTYLARLRELAPDTDDVTRTYAARITIEAPGPEVRLGMTATAFTPDVEGERAIRLPLTAIHDADGKPKVWIVDAASKVSPRPVKLGAAQKDTVLVAEGLQPGDVVVTAGVNQLHAGQKVRAAGSKS